MSQHDYTIDNQSFPSFRTDLNNALSAINSTNSGSSRPSSAVAGTIWLDTSGVATAQLLKLYDGADDILLGTVNFTANTVDWSDSAISLGANSVDSDQYVDGSIDTIHIGDSQITVGKMATNSVNSDQYVDGSIDTAHIADDQITLAKMASGTDGNIISYDASGNPVAIATGTDGQVLTSTGAGSPPAFETPAGGGKVLQVVSAVKTNETSTTSTSYVDITGISVSITPASSSNKILIIANLNFGTPNSTHRIHAQLTGGNSGNYIGDANSSLIRGAATAVNRGNDTYGQTTTNINYLDSPATASAITYKVQWRVSGDTGYLNRPGTIDSIGGSNASTIIVMEVAG